MADTATSDVHAPFGVGAVLSDTFSIFFRKIHIVILLGFIPALIDVIVNTYAWDTDFEAVPGVEFDWATFSSTFVVALLISSVAISLTSAMVIQLAYDAKSGRPAQIGQYFKNALVNLPALAVLSIVSGILIVIGFALVFLPGLWLYAVFSVIVPAIVIDKSGFGALNRSSQLTKGYRWPIVGTLVLLILCIFLVSAAVGFVFAFGFGDTSAIGFEPTLTWIVAEAILNALAYGWTGVAIAMIFARLKEIKEGVSVSDLVDVFR